MKEYNSLNETISDLFGNGVSVKDRFSIAGGDINDAYRLELTDGSSFFMKANRPDKIDFFRCEVAGLNAIMSTGAINTPEALGIGVDAGFSFLIMSFIDRGKRRRDFNEVFGQDLAAMHRASTERFVSGGRYGFSSDNYIGAGPQKNTPSDSFIEFFAECRLRPQFERAYAYFSETEHRDIERFLSRLDKYLTEPEFPSLLHGDLWGGNYMVGNDGSAWLIDPAVYVGHFEADIAMTELFGGFPYEFYDAYWSAMGGQNGYADRRDIYNLYHLLNHLNLFGGGYLSSVRSILRRF